MSEHRENHRPDGGGSCGCSFGIGSLIAGILSWQLNHSVIWCVLHVLMGWVYVIYYLLAYGFTNR